MLLIIGIPVAFWQWTGAQPVQLRIPKKDGSSEVIVLPFKDRQQLEYLFRYLVYVEGDSAYTLIGMKPLSLGVIFQKPILPVGSIYIPILPSSVRLYQAWQTWLKYQYVMKDSHFLLWLEAHNDQIFWVFLADKPKLLATMQKYPKDFKEVLSELNYENIQDLVTIKPFYRQILQMHDQGFLMKKT